MKAIYKHKKSGDIFAIETDGKGRVLSTSGPLLTKDLNPRPRRMANWIKTIANDVKEKKQIPPGQVRESK